MDMCLFEERGREGERKKHCNWNGVATKRTLSSISIKIDRSATVSKQMCVWGERESERVRE